MLVVLSGLPGVGKTAVARELAVTTGAMHLRIDSIEQALRNARWNIEAEGYTVAYAVAEDNLRLGRSVVADCVNPWPLTRNEWQAVANRARVRMLNVELFCSDAAEHRRRVETRSADIAGHILPTWSQVVERDYRPWDGERLIVDTAQFDVRESVRTILSAMGK
jgi:predicted kinase